MLTPTPILVSLLWLIDRSYCRRSQLHAGADERSLVQHAGWQRRYIVALQGRPHQMSPLQGLNRDGRWYYRPPLGG